MSRSFSPTTWNSAPACSAGLALGIACVAAPASAQNFNGTCTNIQYQGSRLVATCLTAYGTYRTSSIDASSCPPANINNANGQLVCSAAGGGYGGGGGGYGGGGYGRPRPYNGDDDFAPPRRYHYGY